MATLQQQQAFYRTHLPYTGTLQHNNLGHPFYILGQMALEWWGQSIAGAHLAMKVTSWRHVKVLKGVWANDNGNRRQFVTCQR